MRTRFVDTVQHADAFCVIHAMSTADVSNSPLIRQYLPFCDGYYTLDGVILYRDHIVLPASLRSIALKPLHAAHQGVSAMERCARATVFWPGLTQDINTTRNSCVHCNRNAPSQAVVPSMPINPPTTPFEHIFATF